MASRPRLEVHAPPARPVPKATVRSAALGTIMDAIRSAETRTIIIRAPAGAGKTWLAQAALRAAEAENALCGSGKFVENQGQAALAPIMAALSSLLKAALDRFYDLQAGLASLTASLGAGLDVLISAGLSFPHESGGTTALSDRRAGIARIAAAAGDLLRWTEKIGMPRALLIDDWNRASPDAVDLIRAIAHVHAAVPLSLLLTEREQSHDSPSEPEATVMLALEPLDDIEAQTLLIQTLGTCEQAELTVTTLGAALPRQPFELAQIAQGLIRDAAFRQTRHGWAIDRAKATRLTFDAPSAVARLTQRARNLAAALALWGDAAPLEPFLAALDEPGDAALADLQDAQIVRVADGQVAFCHDRLREAALQATADRLAGLAAAMAERIPPGADDDLENVALHLRLNGGLEDVVPQRWRDRFARGATAARGRGDVHAASRFAEAALVLRERAPPEDHESERLILHEALLAAANRDDPETEARARRLIAAARTERELYQDYESGIVALRLADQKEAAWRLAGEGLRAIGIAPPSDRPGIAFLSAAFFWWITRSLARASTVGDNTIDVFTGVAAYAADLAYHRNPASAAIVGFRGSLRAGRASRGAAFWWSTDAFLFSALGAYRHSADAAERALASFDRQHVLRAATLYHSLFFGLLWRRPMAELRDRFRDVTRIALAEGDAINACYGLRIFVMSGWRTSASLDALREEAREALSELENIGEAAFVDEMKAMVAMLDGLTGRTAWRPELWRFDLPTRNHVIDLELSNLAGDWAETLRRAERLKPVRRDYDIQVDSVVLRFQESVARLRCGLDVRRRDWRRLRFSAKLNPVDHASKLRLLEAERLRLRGARDVAILDAYSRAIEAAARAASRLDLALALTCAADFADGIAHHGLAREWRSRANRVYADWGVRIETGASVADPAQLAEARARAEAAERADRAKSRLLAHVGHELRTPLQALGSMLDLAASGDTPLDTGGIRDVLSGLTSVVEDLSIADEYVDRQTAGIAGDVDLAELLRSEATMWHRDDRLRLQLDPAPIRVQVAADRVRQIVRNLLSNAIKYGGDAPILVELTLEPLDADVHVRIAVQDGGPGLSATSIEALFDAFERGAHTGDGRGAGLGLALSRRLANRLGGTLDARNVDGGGARFELQFVAHRAAPTPSVSVGMASILLVEDSPLVRPLFAALLAQGGHRVVQGGTVASARDAWRRERFDLAILDLGLPDGDGLSLLAEMRSEGADMPAIILSAAVSAEADALAADDARVIVLRKPVSAEGLHAAVAASIGCEAPAVPSVAPELAQLYAEARTAVIEQASRCLAQLPDRREVHQLAGLAAQFGWMEVTYAVEALGAAIVDGEPLEPARARLEAALTGMAA